jgi:hypothetical protein
MDKDLQQAAIGQVLWVDEAGFLSVRQMLELEEFAVEQNCRLVVTGDTVAAGLSRAIAFRLKTPGLARDTDRANSAGPPRERVCYRTAKYHLLDTIAGEFFRNGEALGIF